MALTAMEVKHLTCPEGQDKIKKSDGNGLFLLVKANGSKLWRMRYKFNCKYQELAFGQYPTIPLLEARKMTVQARSLLVQGITLLMKEGLESVFLRLVSVHSLLLHWLGGSCRNLRGLMIMQKKLNVGLKLS